jgi:hypothetical protein
MLSHGMMPMRVTIQPSSITFLRAHSNGSVVNSCIPSITMTTFLGQFAEPGVSCNLRSSASDIFFFKKGLANLLRRNGVSLQMFNVERKRKEKGLIDNLSSS